MAESKITIYFLKISFRKSLFEVTALAYSAKTYVTFTCTFSKVREDIKKYVFTIKIEHCFVGRAPVKSHKDGFFM